MGNTECAKTEDRAFIYRVQTDTDGYLILKKMEPGAISGDIAHTMVNNYRGRIVWNDTPGFVYERYISKKIVWYKTQSTNTCNVVIYLVDEGAKDTTITGKRPVNRRYKLYVMAPDEPSNIIATMQEIMTHPLESLPYIEARDRQGGSWSVDKFGMPIYLI